MEADASAPLAVDGIQRSPAAFFKALERWNRDGIDATLAVEALATAVMQRNDVANVVKRTLGAKMGSPWNHSGGGWV